MGIVNYNRFLKYLSAKQLRGCSLKESVYLRCGGILQANFPETGLTGTVFLVEETLLLFQMKE